MGKCQIILLYSIWNLIDGRAQTECSGNITKENWYTTKDGIDAVNAELSRILYQFSLLV